MRTGSRRWCPRRPTLRLASTRGPGTPARGAVQARWRPMYSVIASRITSDDGTCRRLAKASTWSEISCDRRPGAGPVGRELPTVLL